MSTVIRYKRGKCRHCKNDRSICCYRHLCSACRKIARIRNQYPTERDRIAQEKLASGEREACRHCKKKPHNKPRKLCYTCYRDPKVKPLYPPSTSKFANRGNADFNGKITMPEPTTALPGTPEKFQVLCQRAENNQSLWHPDDAQWESVPDEENNSHLILMNIGA